MAVLAGLLRQRLKVVLEPDTPLALRPYDTRVLTVIFNVLKAPQLKALLDGIDAWAYADRDGTLRLLPNVEPGVRATKLPIVLDASQVDAFVQHSHADQVLPRLGNTAAAFFQEDRSDQALFANVRAVVQRARRHGFEGLPNWIAFCEAWSQFGADFDQQTPWRERLLEASLAGSSVLDALAEKA